MNSGCLQCANWQAQGNAMTTQHKSNKLRPLLFLVLLLAAAAVAA
jgi:hypothetical protein